MPSRIELLAVGMAVAAVSLAGIASTQQALAQTPPIVVKLGTATLNDAQHEYLKRYAAVIEKNSGGRLKPEIYPASQLGPIPRQIEATQLGAIQMFVCPSEFLDGVDSRFAVVAAAGLFKDMANAAKVLKDEEFRKAFWQLGANRGVRVSAMFMSGPTALNTRKPINKIEDVKGLKLRVSASPLQTRPIAHLGATAVPMALGDVLPALQQGTIDGVMSVLPVLSALRYYDAAKYITETNLSFTISQASISKVWFDKLPPDLQKIVADAALKLGDEMQPFVDEFYQQQRKVWVEKGGTLIELPEAERTKTITALTAVSEDVVKEKAEMKAIWDVALAAAKRN